MELEKSIFDINLIKNDGMRNRYNSILKRGIEASNSFISVYKNNDQNHSINFQYLYSQYFNASAYKMTHGYTVSIHSPVIGLLISLFRILLSYDFVLPEISDSEKNSELKPESVPFIMDISNPKLDVDFNIKLGERKALASTILADLCASFILFHEIGHIICGHAEGVQRYFNENSVTEFLDIDKIINRGKYIRQSWEFNADAVASTLVVQYIDQLYREIISNKDFKNIFSVNGHEKSTIANLLSVINVSFFAMFTYMNGARLKFKKNTHHPHPLTRAFYIKDMLLQVVQPRWGIKLDDIQYYQDKYLDQFLSALESIGLLKVEEINDPLMDKLDAQKQYLKNNSSRFRNFCQRWSWLPPDEWS